MATFVTRERSPRFVWAGSHHLPDRGGESAAELCAPDGGVGSGAEGWSVDPSARDVASTVISLSQPAVGMAFKPALAGRALSGFNLVIFSGVFTVQWGIGLLVDAFAALGLARIASFQAAFSVFLCCGIAAYGYFLYAKVDNSKL